MANTTWNGSDKTAGLTLTGGNLIATTSGVNNGVRATDRQVTGRFYFEGTGTTWTGGGGPGLANSAAVVGSSTWTNNVTLSSAGIIWVNNVNSGFTLGARANGDVIGIAVDFSARLIWFRVAPSGNWNGNATHSPATGAGGIDISVVGGIGIPLYPYLVLPVSGSSFTANFGDSAFTGAVPAGFTSGFTSGASIPTNTIATQVAAEHWTTGTPDVRLTQAFVEHWAEVQTVVPQVALTQILIEQWASVAQISATTQSRVMVLA